MGSRMARICESRAMLYMVCANERCRGPVISPQAKNKIESLIASCEKEGGEIVLDGRGASVEGYPDGNWVGPTLLKAKEGMSCHS
jgi:malonate-semialdehyde dehydrogenase (acetylating)/methylmalonate-semialdehyde dehydrogenase